MSVKYETRVPLIVRELPGRVNIGTEAGAKIVEVVARELVPIRTGALRDAIHTEYQGSGDWDVVAGDGHQVFYGHLVEHGTTQVPARPFLVPALEQSREGIEFAVRHALRTL